MPETNTLALPVALELAEALAARAEDLEKYIHRLAERSDIRSATIRYVGEWLRHDRKYTLPQQSSTRSALRNRAAPMHPYPGHCAVSLSGKAIAVAGFSVIGLSEQALSSFIETIAARQRKDRNFIPVFLTDSDNFRLFRRHGFLFEYIPPEKDREACGGTLPWTDRIAERTESFRRKWNVKAILVATPAGESATGVLPQSFGP